METMQDQTNFPRVPLLQKDVNAGSAPVQTCKVDGSIQA